MAIEVVVKRVGNSLGVIIPKRVAERMGIREGSVVRIEPKTPRRIFGAWKDVRINVEKIEDLLGEEE